MCSMCRSYPCINRCPNAIELKPVYECYKCGNGILDGERYYDSPDGRICEECIDDMTAIEFMELIGETFSMAEKEGLRYGREAE